MSKTDLVNFIAEETGLTKADSSRALEAFMSAVAETLQKGEKITLTGFGSFGVSRREARAGRNPKTGLPVKIAARNSVSFKAGSKLKESVNK